MFRLDNLIGFRYKKPMWIKNYKDYPPDTGVKKEKVISGKGIIGCEMHEQMGYGSSHDLPLKKPSILQRLLLKFFKR